MNANKHKDLGFICPAWRTDHSHPQQKWRNKGEKSSVSWRDKEDQIIKAKERIKKQKKEGPAQIVPGQIETTSSISPVKHKPRRSAPGGAEEDKDDQSKPSQEIPRVTLAPEHFHFHHVLGEGDNGKVLLATYLARGEQVAVKRLEKFAELTTKQAMIEQKVLEISNQCPYLIRGYGAFQDQIHIYYAMELEVLCFLPPYQHCPVLFINLSNCMTF